MNDPYAWAQRLREHSDEDVLAELSSMGYLDGVHRNGGERGGGRGAAQLRVGWRGSLAGPYLGTGPEAPAKRLGLPRPGQGDRRCVSSVVAPRCLPLGPTAWHRLLPGPLPPADRYSFANGTGVPNSKKGKRRNSVGRAIPRRRR